MKTLARINTSNQEVNKVCNDYNQWVQSLDEDGKKWILELSKAIDILGATKQELIKKNKQFLQ